MYDVLVFRDKISANISACSEKRRCVGV